MTFAELTVLAETARSAAENTMRIAFEDAYDYPALLEANLRDIGQDVYDAVFEEGKNFIRPIHPIYEVD